MLLQEFGSGRSLGTIRKESQTEVETKSLFYLRLSTLKGVEEMFYIHE